jgi:hypothetical protein
MSEIAALKWEQIPIDSENDDVILNVKNHAVVHHDGILYLLGGLYHDRMDLVIHDIGARSWKRIQYDEEIKNEGNRRRFVFRRRSRSINSSVHSASTAGSVSMAGPKPNFRNGHTATLVKNVDGKTLIFIIGGWLGDSAASGVLVLDITDPDNCVWVDVQERGASPGPCNMHTAEFIPDKREIYVFRGGDGSEYLNDLHALNVDTMVWRRVQARGVIPEPRADHASAYMEDTKEMFLFGGWNGSTRLNDFYILDTKTSTWTRPNVGGHIPRARAGMTLNAVRDRLYLFGGNGAESEVCSDLHVFDRTQMSFVEIKKAPEKDLSTSLAENGNENGNVVDSKHNVDFYAASSRRKRTLSNPNCIDSIVSVSVSGSGPPKRAGHTATTVGRYIYIIGGSSGSDYRNDCYLLDTDNLILPPDAKPQSFQMMSSHLKDLCNNQELSDVTFIVEGRKIYAHKIVLSLTSEVYRAMFLRNGFREKESGTEIEIQNCTHDVFLAIMEYMYTGEIDLSLFATSSDGREERLERVLGILEMADHLLLEHLKQKCERALFHSVNAASFEFLMEFAKDSNAKHLEAICSHYARNSRQAMS